MGPDEPFGDRRRIIALHADDVLAVDGEGDLILGLWHGLAHPLSQWFSDSDRGGFRDAQRLANILNRVLLGVVHRLR